VKEYVVTVLVPLPRSPMKLVQTLLGSKFGEYAALNRLFVEVLQALSKVTVKHCDEPVLLTNEYVK
jgi:hypothetical protein